MELCTRVVTTKSFIEEAKEIYGDKYDYSKVDYKNKEHQVIVGCSVHGDFKIYAREHLDGKGCPKCTKGEKFIQKLQAKFGDKFLLDKFIYESSTSPVELICPIHGSFSRLPNAILATKCGCPDCGNDLSRQLQEQAHAEAEERKAEERKKKEEERKAELQEWYAGWFGVINRCRKDLDLWPKGCQEYYTIVNGHTVINPLDVYRKLVDQYIDLIRCGGRRKMEVAGITPISECEARNLSNFRFGDTYYILPNDAAKPVVIDYATNVHNSNVEQLCNNLSHRECHVSFLGNDLLIREGRAPFFAYLDGAEELLDKLRNKGVNEWENMKVFVSPFDDVIYVTEDIRMESAKHSNDVTKWFFLPFDERCNINVIKYGCEVYNRMMYSYKVFKSYREEQLYDFLEEGQEYNFEEVALEFSLATSTIKTIVRSLERYGAICIAKYQGGFVVYEKKCKAIMADAFLEDYMAMTKDIFEYSKSPQASYNTTMTKRIIAGSRGKSISVDDLPTSFVSIDFETLYPQRVSACSVGMVKYKDGKIVDRYYSLIRPPFDYPGKCGEPLTWVHGFKESDFDSERTFVDILPEMETFAEGLPLVAHYASVERACICQTAAYYGLNTVLDFEHIIDTCPMSKLVEHAIGIDIEGPDTHKLHVVCERFNVPLLHHHNALDDAEMCGNLLIAFREALSKADVIIPPAPKEVTVIPKINPEDKVQRTDLENVIDNPFKDKVIVLTGFAKEESQRYAHQLNELGAIIKDSVNKKTNILITGYNAGPSKLKKAEEFGVLIISEDELIEILKSI